MRINFSAISTALLLLLCGCGGQSPNNGNTASGEAVTTVSSVKDTSETSASAETQARETAAETSESTLEAISVSENVSEATQDGLTDSELEDMAIVDDLIDALVKSEDFQAAAKEERAQMSLELLYKLGESSEEAWDHPLIKKESISYEGGDIIGFQYSCGVLGGIMIVPFDPMMN